MPDEPNPSIDEQLRAFARQRRGAAGEPFDLPPAARKLLQDEIARMQPSDAKLEPAREPRWAWLGALWPRLAFAAVVFGLLAITALFWLPKKDKFDVALNQTTSQQTELQLAPAQPAPAQEPSISEDAKASAATLGKEAELIGSASLAKVDRLPEAGPVSDVGFAPTLNEPLDRTQAITPALSQRGAVVEPSAKDTLSRENDALPTSESLASAAPAAPQVTTLAITPPEQALDQTRTVESKARGIGSQPASKPEAQTVVELRLSDSAAAAAAVPNPAAPQVFHKEAKRGEALRNVSFRRVEARTDLRRNFNSPPPPSVLHEFRLELEGAKVRLIDTDGSVYEGSVDPDFFAQPGRLAESLAERTEALSKQASAVHASGFNRRLSKEVIFNGQLEAEAIESAKTGEAQAGSNLSGSNWRLRGKVSVGGRTEFPIEAVSAVR